MRLRQLSILLALAALVPLSACGDDTSPSVDAGTDSAPADSGADDSSVDDTSVPPPTPGVCEEPVAATGEVGTITVTGDTSMVMARPRDLGECGNEEAPRFAPQEVVAYTVPGSGEIGVSFTLDTAGTASDFAAVLQVRTDCETIPPSSACYGAVDRQPTLPAAGGILANGGDVIYFIVTGWADVAAPYTDRGAWAMDITAGPISAPTLVAGQLARVGDTLEVTLSTTDDLGAETYRLEVQTADGMGIDVNGDGSVDEGDWLVGEFIEDSAPAFVGTDRWLNLFGRLLDDAMAVQAEVAVRDIFGAESAPMTLSFGPAAGVGEACSATVFCAQALTCTADLCAASAPAVSDCAGSTALTIDTPTDMTTRTTVSGTVPAGTGSLSPGCTAGVGPEAIYTVTVPATGTYDVIARTDLSGTGSTDTLLYLRTTCEDPTTELVCNDDIDYDGMVYTSHIDLLDAAAGDHVIVVEQWSFFPTDARGPFQMEVSLRPVLATGAACDNAGANNRCAAGACAASVCP